MLILILIYSYLCKRSNNFASILFGAAPAAAIALAVVVVVVSVSIALFLARMRVCVCVFIIADFKAYYTRCWNAQLVTPIELTVHERDSASVTVQANGIFKVFASYQICSVDGAV